MCNKPMDDFEKRAREIAIKIFEFDDYDLANDLYYERRINGVFENAIELVNWVRGELQSALNQREIQFQQDNARLRIEVENLKNNIKFKDQLHMRAHERHLKERDALKVELDELKSEHELWLREADEPWRAHMDQAAEANKKLRVNFLKFAKHDADCYCERYVEFEYEAERCDCGFYAARTAIDEVSK